MLKSLNYSLWKSFWLPALILMLSCQPSEERQPNVFSDPDILKIADLQDKRLTDSLDIYLDHENPAYRLRAVLAFGSIQNISNVDRIGKLALMDADPAVRKAAAFSLGQINNASCERILLGALVKEKIPENTFEILNAYGKTTSRWNLDPRNFMDDSVRSAGLAWSLYRAGLRNKTGDSANAVAMRLLDPTMSKNTRLGAAHFFARGAKNFQQAEQFLIRAATSDTSPEVRMAAALGVGKTASDSSLIALKSIIKAEKDTRVVINVIRALTNFPYDNVKHYLYEALLHKDVQVGVAASEVIVQKLPSDQWIDVSSLINQVDQPRIAANLYEAALMGGGHKDLAAEIQKRYQTATNPFDKAWMLGALKHYPPAFSFVVKELSEADTAVLRSAAAATLAAMGSHRSVTPQMKVEFANVYREIIQSENDPAVIGMIAGVIGDSASNYRAVIKEADFLHSAKKKLRLPEHIEALQPLEDAIAYIEKRKRGAPLKNEFNHPIDWPFVTQIAHDQRATIKTTRGNIRIQLNVNESPGSVANFVALAEGDYFDGKAFHRVVPNFVVQAGCNRGDGWGSENYSIRSEFSPRRYKTGSVGMASAGKDTEGTQWFITHSPTPHLDGRYTLFAEVIEGMQVLDYLQVGDKITDVVIENFKDR